MAKKELLSITDICRLVPGRHGGRVHRNTVLGWIHVGSKGVKLKASKQGNYWIVRRADLDAWLSYGAQEPDPPIESLEAVYDALKDEFGIAKGGDL